MECDNGIVRVVARDDGTFDLARLPGGQMVVADGKLPVAGTLTKQDVHDPVLGTGMAIDITSANGAGARVAVYQNVPFAMIWLTLANDGKSPKLLNRVSVAAFDVDLGVVANQITTMGTGGLATADKNPGSYTWLAVAAPATRHGVVAAWLTNERASGVLFPHGDGDRVRVEARSDYGRLRIMPGKTERTQTLAIGYFDDARLGLEQWADCVARVEHIHLKPQPTGYCTWYAEKHGAASDEKNLARLVDFAGTNLVPYGFGFVQIDDHWQMGDPKGNGPRKNFTAFDPHGPYPSGMKATADTIKAHGMIAGLWFMPFAGTYNDPWFADKQSFFVRRADGSPYDTAWGGTCLDMTRPAARDYVRSEVSRIAHDWGYGYFKLDGLWTGMATKQVYVNSGYHEDDLGDAVFFNPDKTNIEAYRDGLRLVREAAGPHVFLLGCNVAQDMRTYGASFGLLDAMRIGPDNGGSWRRWSVSPIAGSRNYFLNGRIWYNDADPMYVRASIPIDEARTIASWTTIVGALNTDSDWLPDLPPDRLNILRRTMPAHGKIARPVDYFEHDPPREWIVSDDTAGARRDVAGLFNWSDKDADFNIPLERLGLPPAKSYFAFDYWGDQFMPPLEGNLKARVRGHGCLVLSIRAAVDHPIIISTSRHITQGMIDLSDEKWDPAARTLSAASAVVGNDDYEIRIAGAKAGAKPTVSVSEADRAAGVEIGLVEGKGGVRVKVRSVKNRVVKWAARFE